MNTKRENGTQKYNWASAPNIGVVKGFEVYKLTLFLSHTFDND